MIRQVCVFAALLVVSISANRYSSSWARVPGGALIHRSCIYSVPSGFKVQNVQPCPFIANLKVPEDQLYNMDVHYTPNSEVMQSMNASFIAPTLPAQDDSQVVYFWPGFKSTQPTMGLPVLQPVLQYGTDCCGGGDYWCVRSWFVYGDIGVAYQSSECPVNPGDLISSQMRFDTTSNVWTINAYNTNSKQNTTLLIDYASTDSTTFHVAMLTMETIMDQSVCADLPASNSIEFSDITVNGRPIKWTDRVTDHSCGEKITDQSTTVTFEWNS